MSQFSQHKVYNEQTFMNPAWAFWAEETIKDDESYFTTGITYKTAKQC